jgi:archaemetzincin
MNRNLLILIYLLLTIVSSSCHNNETVVKRNFVTIDIQPFEGFSNQMTHQVANQIKEIYPHITVKPEIPLPISSFYAPRNRFRADSLIRFLKSRTAKDHVTIGLTHKDISTTDGEIKDWGVMGLGYYPGSACVVSTFRLKKERLSSQFYKVCIHELGHSSGLDHCPEKTCFMRDAEGGNPTDDEKEFCNKCRKVLIKKGWILNDAARR